jgi:hypothetical protein
LSVSNHVAGPTSCFSLTMIFSFLSIIQVLQCAFLTFHVFECFSPYFRSYTMHISFSMF